MNQFINISLVARFAMLLLLCAQSTFALIEGNYTYEINTADDTTVTIKDYKVTDHNARVDLSIPSMLGGKKVTIIGKDAFRYGKTLTSVVIPNGVIKIGDYAFSGCENMISVTIPDSVVEIGICGFMDCDVLASVTIPNSIKKISSNLFTRCGKLASMTIPNSVTEIDDYAFSSCKALTSVTIPGSVRFIGEWAFADCTSLSGAYFRGTPPEPGAEIFFLIDPTVYYQNEAEWGEVGGIYGSRPAVLWAPLIQDQDSNFGMQPDGTFAFDVKSEGINGALVKVEASEDLVNWEEQETLIIESDDDQQTFSDSETSAHSKRFYRLNMP